MFHSYGELDDQENTHLKMIRTTEQARIELRYALSNFFSDTPEQYVQLISMTDWEHITDIRQMTPLTREDIGCLRYLKVPGDERSVSKIPVWMAARLRLGLAFYSNKCREKDRLIPWAELNVDDLEPFRTQYDPQRTYPEFTPSRAYEPPVQPETRISPSERFITDPKVDASRFPSLNSPHEWHRFKREFKEEVIFQGVTNVIDANYHPISEEDTTLLNTQSDYLWHVLQATIRTPEGQGIVNNHGKKKDARRVYQHLVEYYTTDTATTDRSNDLFQEIAAANVVTERGEASRENYLSTWIYVLNHYNASTFPGAQLTGGLCTNLLKRVIKDDEQLKIILERDYPARTPGRAPMTYKEYSTMVLEASKKADRQDEILMTASTLPGREEDYDFKTQEENQSRLQGPSLDRETWDQMDEPSRRGWQQLEPDGKAAILNFPADLPEDHTEDNADDSSIILTNPPQPYVCMFYGTKYLELQYDRYMRGQGSNDDYDVLEGESKEAYVHRLLARPPPPTAGGIRSDSSSNNGDSTHSGGYHSEGGVEEEKTDEEGLRIDFRTPATWPTEPPRTIPWDNHATSWDNDTQDGQADPLGEPPLPEPNSTHTEHRVIQEPGMVATHDDQADPLEERPLPEPNPTTTTSTIDSRSVNEIRITPMDGHQILQVTNSRTDQNPNGNKSASTKKRRVNDVDVMDDPYSQSHGNITNTSSSTTYIQGKEEKPCTKMYCAAIPKRRPKKGGSLINKGTTGGILGLDAITIETTNQRTAVFGLNYLEPPIFSIGTGAAYIKSKQGPFIGIFGQYAISEKGETLHSTAQLESFGISTGDEFDLLADGPHTITTKCQREIPAEIINGLVYMEMRPYTKDEFTQLPHIQMTSEMEWDPITMRNTDNTCWSNDIVPSKTFLINHLELADPDNPTEERCRTDNQGYQPRKTQGNNTEPLPTAVPSMNASDMQHAKHTLSQTNSSHQEDILALVNTWGSNKLIDSQRLPNLYEEMYCTLQRHSQELDTVFDNHLTSKRSTYQQNILSGRVTPHETCQPNHTDNCWSEDFTLTAEEYSGIKDWDQGILDDIAAGYLPPGGHKITNTIPQGKHILKPAPILNTKDNPHNKGERDIENDMRHVPPDPKATLAQEKGE